MKNKYKKFFIQILLSIPFYYVSMVVVNILMVLYREVERITTKKGFELDIKAFKDFKFEINGLFSYNEANMYVYLGVGLFLTYFYVLKPIIELKKELKKESEFIPDLYDTPSKSRVDGYLESKEETEKEGLKTVYEKKDASTVLSEEFNRELGTNKKPNIKPKPKKRINLDEEEEEYLNRNPIKEKKEKVETKSEELYADDTETFFLNAVQPINNRIALNNLNSLEELAEENEDEDEEELESYMNPKRVRMEKIQDTEISQEEDDYAIRERLNQIEREKLRKRLTTFNREE